MQDYQKMYFALAAKVADVIEMLELAQCQGEDDYITGGEAPLSPRVDSGTAQRRRLMGETPSLNGLGGGRGTSSLPAEATGFLFRNGEMGTLRWTEV